MSRIGNVVLMLCLLLGLNKHTNAQDVFFLKLKVGAIPVSERSGFENTINNNEIINGHYYRYAFFKQLPTATERARISEYGISFLEFVKTNAYLLQIPVGVTPQELGKLGISALTTVNAEFKCTPDLVGFNPPSWAKIGDRTKVNVLVHDLISHEAAKNQFKLLNGIIDEFESDEHVITLTIPTKRVLELAALPFVRFIEPISPPNEPENLPGLTNHRANLAWSPLATGYRFNGSGMVVGMGDDGRIGPHIDYKGRDIQAGVTSNNGNHGDHVGGTIFGGGNLDPRARGMAWGSTLRVFQYNGGLAYTPASYNNEQMRIMNSSYSDGCNAGYTTRARNVDEQQTTLDELLHIFSAGNNGTTNCNYGAGNVWGNITGGHKVGKNCITVSNITNSSVANASSSRGPAEDGRLKPEVSAVGTNVYSTVEGNIYDTYTGTSMSAPGVAGCLALIYEAYKSFNNNQTPKGALAKALLMNSCDDIGTPGPDFIYGYGQINVNKTIQNIENNRYLTDTVDGGFTKTHTITVPAGTKRLKAMLYWADVPASTSSLNALVNDLDLTVTNPQLVTFQPLVLDPTPSAAALSAPAVPGRDSLNNSEQVVIENPTAGTYTVTVDGFSVPFGPQRYYLVWDFEQPTIRLTYPQGGEGFIPGLTEIIRWDAGIDTGSFIVDYSTDNGATWSNIGTATASQRFINWAVPNTVTKDAKVRVSQGSLFSSNTINFTIVGVPTNLQVTKSCIDSITLTWNAVSGASGYEVSALGQFYMDSVARTNNTSITLAGFSASLLHYFAIRAIVDETGIGHRSIAIRKDPGLLNCSANVDVAVSKILSPRNGLTPSCMAGPFKVKVRLKNEGLQPVSNFSVSVRQNSNNLFSETIANTLQPGDSLDYTFNQTIATPISGATISVVSALTTDLYSLNDTSSIRFVRITRPTISAPNITNFEALSNSSITGCSTVVNITSSGWLNEANDTYDDIDWRVYTNTTPTILTGPTSGYNGTDKYVYLEANLCYGRTANLASPCFQVPTGSPFEFRFAYHQYGTNQGPLSVDLLVDGEFLEDFEGPFIGNDTTWQLVTIPLTQFAGKTIQIILRGTTGFGNFSDLAVDELQFDFPLSTEKEITNANFQVYPNPTEGTVFLKRNDVNLNKPLVVRVMDLTGRTLNTFNWTNNQSTEIDLSAYAAGVYLIEVSGSGKAYFKIQRQ